MAVHQRKCWECGNVAEHKDNIVPEVLCKKCGSQDTRAVKKPQQPCGHAALYRPPNADAEEWRKGVSLIASALGEKYPNNPSSLCCVTISERVLEVLAENEQLREKNNSLQIDIDLAKLERRDALEVLKEFQSYDGNDDLWAAMKQDRDELRLLLFTVINGDTLPNMSGRINRALEGFVP